MNLTDELRKLSELHQAGHLTDQEFSDSKRRLIEDNHVKPAALVKEERVVADGLIQIEEKTFESSL